MERISCAQLPYDHGEIFFKKYFDRPSNKAINADLCSSLLEFQITRRAAWNAAPAIIFFHPIAAENVLALHPLRTKPVAQNFSHPTLNQKNKPKDIGPRSDLNLKNYGYTFLHHRLLVHRCQIHPRRR